MWFNYLRSTGFDFACFANTTSFQHSRSSAHYSTANLCIFGTLCIVFFLTFCTSFFCVPLFPSRIT